MSCPPWVGPLRRRMDELAREARARHLIQQANWAVDLTEVRRGPLFSSR